MKITLLALIACVCFGADTVLVVACIDPKTGREYGGFEVTDAETAKALAAMLKDAPELTREEYLKKCAERVILGDKRKDTPNGFSIKMGAQKSRYADFDLINRVSFDGQTERKLNVEACSAILLKLVKMGKDAGARRKPLPLPPIAP